MDRNGRNSSSKYLPVNQTNQSMNNNTKNPTAILSIATYLPIHIMKTNWFDKVGHFVDIAQSKSQVAQHV